MDIGIGLPSTIPGVEGTQLTEWSRRAEDAGFSSLGAIDRIVYPNYEPLIALAAAGAVTERIRLMSTIAIVPYRANAALLAKQVATIHSLSGGRFVFGAAVGAREDDYAASGVSIHERGRLMDEMLAEIERYWQGDEVGPEVDPPPPMLIGGSVDAAFRRAARYGAGWMLGGGTPEMVADGRERTIAAFKEAGREDEPRIAALAYYGLGDAGPRDADSYLRHYYAFLGEYAGQVAGAAATDAATVKQYIAGFEQAGCDELVFIPTSTDPAQVDLLADAALG